MGGQATSIRIPEGMADDLAAIARADGKPIAEVMREALEHYIASRRSDQEFKARLRKRLEEDREYLDRIGG